MKVTKATNSAKRRGKAVQSSQLAYYLSMTKTTQNPKKLVKIGGLKNQHLA